MSGIRSTSARDGAGVQLSDITRIRTPAAKRTEFEIPLVVDQLAVIQDTTSHPACPPRRREFRHMTAMTGERRKKGCARQQLAALRMPAKCWCVPLFGKQHLTFITRLRASAAKSFARIRKREWSVPAAVSRSANLLSPICSERARLLSVLCFASCLHARAPFCVRAPIIADNRSWAATALIVSAS